VSESSKARKAALIGVSVVAGVFGITAAVLQIRNQWRQSPIDTIQITGTVLRDNKHADEQSPIANASILATGGFFDVEGKSDAAGLFQLNVRLGFRRRDPIRLKFEHADYKPVEIGPVTSDRIYVVRMEPIVPAPSPEPSGEERALPVRDIRIRYTLRSETKLNIGSVAKRFQVANTGDLPCAGNRVCSPDGKWKGSSGGLSLDAGNGNQFQNVRVTCIAGPCPFTRVAPVDPVQPSRVIHVTALDWSDTTVFLVEAELTRTAVSNSTRRLYPTVIGSTMTFALPAGSEGATVEAALNGEEIVFPLGPRMILSWATCGVEVAHDQSRIYRCELKSGYAFPP
jgi:hypothetical protein